MILDAYKEIFLIGEHEEKIEQAGVNLGVDTLTLIQPYLNNQAIIWTIDKDKHIHVEASEMVVILPRKEGLLDVFRNPNAFIDELSKREDVTILEVTE